MRKNNSIATGRKAETIYTAMKKKCADKAKQRKACAVCHRVRSFEKYMEKNTTSKACYVSVNGITMPILSA